MHVSWIARRRGLAAFALTALLTLGLGAAADLEHHLLDAGCEAGAAGESHPCVCASLHGGALVEHFEAPEPWRLVLFRPHPPLADRVDPLHAGLAAPPRAPPLS
jgi:hypothetical protein